MAKPENSFNFSWEPESTPNLGHLRNDLTVETAPQIPSQGFIVFKVESIDPAKKTPVEFCESKEEADARFAELVSQNGMDNRFEIWPVERTGSSISLRVVGLFKIKNVVSEKPTTLQQTKE